MPPRSKMKKILDKRKGKVSPLEPGDKTPKRKRTGIRVTAKKAQETAAAKKKAAAKKPLTSQQRLDKAYVDKYGDKDKPKVKKDKASPKKTSAAKKAAKKVSKAKVPGTGVGAGMRVLGALTGVGAYAAGAYSALNLVDPVMRHLFPKSEPRKSTPELRASQKRMNKAMGSGRDPEIEIHGGGSPLGLQVDEAKKAVSPLTLTGAVKVAPKDKKEKNLLGRNKPRPFKDTAGIPNMDVDTEGTLSRYPSALEKTTKKLKPEVVKKSAKNEAGESNGKKPKPKAKVVKKSAKAKVVKKSAKAKVVKKSAKSELVDDYNYTPRKKSSPRETDPASADGPGPAPKRLNENAFPTKGKTNIKDKFDKLMQDSSRGDRHLGAPKKKPLGMEDAFWDGASWVR